MAKTLKFELVPVAPARRIATRDLKQEMVIKLLALHALREGRNPPLLQALDLNRLGRSEATQATLNVISACCDYVRRHKRKLPREVVTTAQQALKGKRLTSQQEKLLRHHWKI